MPRWPSETHWPLCRCQYPSSRTTQSWTDLFWLFLWNEMYWLKSKDKVHLNQRLTPIKKPKTYYDTGIPGRLWNCKSRKLRNSLFGVLDCKGMHNTSWIECSKVARTFLLKHARYILLTAYTRIITFKILWIVYSLEWVSIHTVHISTKPIDHLPLPYQSQIKIWNNSII